MADPNQSACASVKLFVWGAGRPTRRRVAHLEHHGLSIDGFIDIDRRNTGRLVAGGPVMAAADLPGPGEIFVLGYVASRGARDLIRRALAGRGHVEGRNFLMCA